MVSIRSEAQISLGIEACHFDGVDPFIKLLSSKIAEVYGFLFEGRTILVGCFGNFSRLVVPDMRIERRHQHKGVVEVPLDKWQIGLNALGAMLVEADACIGQ